MSRVKRRLISSFFAVLFIFCMTSTFTVFASDETISAQYVKITGNNFVADTLDGVPALYNENGPAIQCNEYVMRYYREVYGWDVWAYSNIFAADPPHELKVTSKPKSGDIWYSSAEQRGKSYDHWAIVKDYSDGVITLIEQNYSYNGRAAVNRKVRFPSNTYTVYTPVGAVKKRSDATTKKVTTTKKSSPVKVASKVDAITKAQTELTTVITTALTEVVTTETLESTTVETTVSEALTEEVTAVGLSETETDTAAKSGTQISPITKYIVVTAVLVILVITVSVVIKKRKK